MNAYKIFELSTCAVLHDEAELENALHRLPSLALNWHHLSIFEFFSS